MSERVHSAACSRCGATIPYLGRRDLVQVLEGVYRAMSCGEMVSALGCLREALQSVRGVCACASVFLDDDGAPVRLAAVGTCHVCHWVGRGIAPDGRCPVLGCPGSMR